MIFNLVPTERRNSLASAVNCYFLHTAEISWSFVPILGSHFCSTFCKWCTVENSLVSYIVVQKASRAFNSSIGDTCRWNWFWEEVLILLGAMLTAEGTVVCLTHEWVYGMSWVLPLEMLWECVLQLKYHVLRCRFNFVFDTCWILLFGLVRGCQVRKFCFISM